MINAGGLTLSQIERIVTMLGNEQGVQRFLSGEFLLSEKAKAWKIWKKIKLGGITTASSFQDAFQKTGIKIGKWANDILGNIPLASSCHEVDLVITSVPELGFEGRATLREIYERAEKLGLGLCPPEVGPQLRLQYMDQPECEWLVIAMKPISGSDGIPNLFYIMHDDEDNLWIKAEDGDPEGIWYKSYKFIFMRKQTELSVTH